jgi:hypothetical protein
LQNNWPSREKLERVWRAVKQDPDGARALKVLREAGWDLGAVPVDTYTWSGMVASIPFLPNRRARSSRQPSYRSARPLARWLREMAQAILSPYTSVEAHDPRVRVIHINNPEVMVPHEFVATAAFLERTFSLRWAVTHHNPYQNVIASLRWEARARMEHPHDHELIDLIDAAFRVAGKDGFPMGLDAFKKVLAHEQATRVAGRRKLLGPAFKI